MPQEHVAKKYCKIQYICRHHSAFDYFCNDLFVNCIRSLCILSLQPHCKTFPTKWRTCLDEQPSCWFPWATIRTPRGCWSWDYLLLSFAEGEAIWLINPNARIKYLILIGHNSRSSVIVQPKQQKHQCQDHSTVLQVKSLQRHFLAVDGQLVDKPLFRAPFIKTSKGRLATHWKD